MDPLNRPRTLQRHQERSRGGPHVTRTSLAHTGEHLNPWSLLSSHESLAPLKSLASDSLIGTPERRPPESASDKPTPLSIPRSPLLGQPCHPERILPSSVGLFIWHVHSNVEVWLLVLSNMKTNHPRHLQPPETRTDGTRPLGKPWEQQAHWETIVTLPVLRCARDRRLKMETHNSKLLISRPWWLVLQRQTTVFLYRTAKSWLVTLKKKMHDVLTCCGLTNEPSTLIHKHFPPKTEV